MVRSLAVALAVSALFPAVSPAGWGDILNSVERVDKLITNRPSAPAAEPAETYDQAPPSRDDIPALAPRAGHDAHFIQPDDYFISEHELGDHTWMHVTLSKMVTRPSSSTKEEGEFMTVHGGQNRWTANYWQSRIASPGELKLGLHVIAFDDNQRNGIYLPPAKKEAARGGQWFYARITDMSDMYKGYVTVSGNYKVGLKNIRIPVR